MIVFLVLAAVALAGSSAQAQTGDERRFPNGITVRGEFLKFYQSAPDPWLLFGDPISGEIEVPNKRVQYFERARLELAETDKGPTVTLAALGEYQYDQDKARPSGVSGTSPTCRIFVKSGHSVCYKMLEFYDQYDGPKYFGEPVSDLILVDERMVQYFEYARLEWRYNIDGELAVGLTDVGRLAYRQIYGSDPKSSSKISRRGPLQATDFQVRAFVEQALVAPGAGNTIFVVAQDMALKPIKGASVTVSTALKNGSTTFPAQTTDENGIAKIRIPDLSIDPKQIVQFQVSVVYERTTVTTTTWYRVWY